MSNSRSQDKTGQTPPRREDRVFTEQNLWYFRIREGNSVGPFRYRSEAESNLDQFLADLEDRLEALGSY